MPGSAPLLRGGKLDGGHRPAGAALSDHIARAAFAPAALGSHAELELDVFESHAGMGMTRDLPIGDTVADADDHGRKGSRQLVNVVP